MFREGQGYQRVGTAIWDFITPASFATQRPFQDTTRTFRSDIHVSFEVLMMIPTRMAKEYKVGAISFTSCLNKLLSKGGLS